MLACTHLPRIKSWPWPLARFGTLLLAAVVALIGVAPARALEPGLSVDVGREFVKLPGTSFTYLYDRVVQSAPNAVPAKNENHDGSSDGNRWDGSYALRTVWFGMPVTAGVKGYYATSTSTQSGGCTPVSALLGCGYTPLSDPNAATQQLLLLIPSNRTVDSTSSRVTTWGTHIEVQTLPQRTALGALSWKGGFGYRQLSVQTLLKSNIVGTLANMTLDDATSTGYAGSYVGAVLSTPLGMGVTFNVDADAGLYWAQTHYSGTYAQTGAIVVPTINVVQSITLDRNAAALIGSLRLGLDRDFGAFKVGVFAKGEFYSYAPQMAYNDVDRTTACTLPCGGGQDGTSIGAGAAYFATFGARVAVPFGP